MSAIDLELAVERHATSKIPEGDLFHIQTFGFRGEALPSLGAVARLCLTSRPKNQEEAWTLRVEGGKKFPQNQGPYLLELRLMSARYFCDSCPSQIPQAPFYGAGEVSGYPPSTGHFESPHRFSAARRDSKNFRL